MAARSKENFDSADDAFADSAETEDQRTVLASCCETALHEELLDGKSASERGDTVLQGDFAVDAAYHKDSDAGAAADVDRRSDCSDRNEAVVAGTSSVEAVVAETPSVEQQEQRHASSCSTSWPSSHLNRK